MDQSSKAMGTAEDSTRGDASPETVQVDVAEPRIMVKPDDERAKVDTAKAPAASVRPQQAQRDPYIRAENEDDDGYDPYSDRRPEPEPLFEPDPWR